MKKGKKMQLWQSRLLELRKKAGKTQDEMATILHIAPRTYRSMETDCEYNPSLSYIIAAAD